MCGCRKNGEAAGNLALPIHCDVFRWQRGGGFFFKVRLFVGY